MHGQLVDVSNMAVLIKLLILMVLHFGRLFEYSKESVDDNINL